MYPRLNLTAAAGLSELSFIASRYSFYSERCLKGWINPQQGLFRIWEVFKPVIALTWLNIKPEWS